MLVNVGLVVGALVRQTRFVSHQGAWLSCPRSFDTLLVSLYYSHPHHVTLDVRLTRLVDKVHSTIHTMIPAFSPIPHASE